MKSIKPILIIVALMMLLSTMGCYTKFYRPGMESQTSAYDKLYIANDSTAIDTMLTEDKSGGSTSYPNNDDRWYYWGRPRGYTNWGFDFYNFSPGYYWTYQGYYDYYGTPWWNNNYYDPWWNPSGGNGVPSEPPSQREHGRREYDGGGSYASPPAAGGSYVAPPAANPTPPKKATENARKDTNNNNNNDNNKRDGRRGK
jgi:hypothetical protein